MPAGPTNIVDIAADLRRESVVLHEVEWTSRHYVTRTPVAGEFDVWRAELRLECSSSEVLVAIVLRTDDLLAFGRQHRSHATNVNEVDLAFLPEDWHQSDDVLVSASCGLAMAQLVADSRELKIAPLEETTIAPASELRTGAICRLATVDRLGLAVEAILIAKSDTEGSHGRWRLPASAEPHLPEHYRFLLTGAVSGNTRSAT